MLAILAALVFPMSGTFDLPAGLTNVAAELKLPDGAHDLTIRGHNSTLRAAPGFNGRAVLSCKSCRRVSFYNFSIDGNRSALAKSREIAPSDRPFSAVFPDNGILVEDTDGLEMEHVDFTEIVGFAVLVNHSRNVFLAHISVKNSGSRNAKGRNNTSGGILLEEGVDSFTVADSQFENILGNAVWTHSIYGSPRNSNGKVANVKFFDIGRDAIQIGHATRVTIEGNSGARIGLRAADVDAEGGGTPVAIDTAGNVDQSVYQYNRFEEIDGKCIDLDGFHDGAIRSNVCINRGKPEDYPFGHFGIVFNNANIDMHSENILVEDNQLDGMKFGGIFVIGSGHRILRNRMSRIDTAHCNENSAKFGCSVLGEPEVLESGIYLGSHAEHPAPARGNLIEGNTISGWKMKSRCIQTAPGVKLSDNSVKGNICTDE
jgi:hypothetical protein